jgi:hypothetical protein
VRLTLAPAGTVTDSGADNFRTGPIVRIGFRSRQCIVQVAKGFLASVWPTCAGSPCGPCPPRSGTCPSAPSWCAGTTAIAPTRTTSRSSANSGKTHFTWAPVCVSRSAADISGSRLSPPQKKGEVASERVTQTRGLSARGERDAERGWLRPTEAHRGRQATAWADMARQADACAAAAPAARRLPQGRSASGI